MGAKLLRRWLAAAVGGLAAAGMALPLHGLTAHASPQTFNVVTQYGADPTGVKDSTLQVQAAINAAQSAGPSNIVYFPTGHYVFFKKISGGNSLTVSADSPSTGADVPVVLQGDGPTASVLTEQTGKNLLNIQTDGSEVTQLELNTSVPNSSNVYVARVALLMAASNTLVQNVTVLGGPLTYAVYYPGAPGATRQVPVYDTGNTINYLTVSDNWTKDGFSFAFQQNGTIQNITHTGSRLALYIDKNITVDTYHFTPGPNAGGGGQGFWITPPSDSIAINNFTTEGNGGTIGLGGIGSVTNSSVTNEVFNNPNFHLTVDNVKGLTITGCDFGTNSQLRFQPNIQATGVVVQSCTSLPAIRFVQSSKKVIPVSAEFTGNTYPTFTPVTGEGSQTFLNNFGGSTDFTVNNGAFHNCTGGFFKGSNTTFAVNALSGYPCSKDHAPVAALSLAPSPGTSSFSVAADASASTDGDHSPIADYQFTWGDGAASPRQPSAKLTHTYSSTGPFTVTVDVIDTAGLNTEVSHQVAPNLVGNPCFTDQTGWTHNNAAKFSVSSTATRGCATSGQLTRAKAGSATLSDSPPWNSSTVAGTTCTISAWVQSGGSSVALHVREYQGSTLVARYSTSVSTTPGAWAFLSRKVAPAHGGDSLHLMFQSSLGAGQSMLVDDVLEECY